MTTPLQTLACVALLAVSCGAARGGETWPQFRGPAGDGHADDAKLPLTWSETENVRWKSPIHGRAWSSPVIWKSQVWLTTASEDGRALWAVCIDRETGKTLHDLELFKVEAPQFAHKFNTYASPTPVIEEGFVYVTFGAPGTACIDTRSGKVVWERRDFVCNHFRGAGSSPIVHGNLLIMNFDGSDHQFVAALDKQTGKTVWRSNRSIDYKDLTPEGKPEADGDWRKAFATPHVAQLGGMTLLLSSGAKAHYAYVPETGEEIWRVEERTCHSASARPLVGHGMVFINTGWSTGQLLAVRPGRKGEVLDANVDEPSPSRQLGLEWKSKRSVPRKPSMILSGDLLFTVLDEGGVVGCLEAKTGKEVWRERISGNYSASPIISGGRIYFSSEEGKTTVVEASTSFKVVATNTLEQGFMASPAVAGNSLFLRTRTHLYRIEDGK